MTNGQKVAVGVGIVALGALAAYLLLQGAGDADKTLTLAMNGNTCTITTPPAEKDVEVGRNKKITWSVNNTCTSDQLVLVGNFRPTQPDGGITDCKAGIIESTWPFKNLDDQAHRQVYVAAGATQAITLKEAKNDSGTKITVYFDICMAGKKVDPRLDIDP